jgi:hypothetical protein
MVLFWFSQEEPNWNSIIRNGRKVFEQNGYKLQDWQNCSVSAFSTDSGKVRVNVRRRNIQYSMYMKRDIEIKFLYGFDISSIEEPVIEKYDQSGSWRSSADDGQEFRWVIHLKKEGNQHRDRRDCSIWQWTAAQGDIRQSDIFRLYRDIEIKLKSSSNYINLDNVDVDDTEANDQVIPVIVQPSTDGWKNFVRQVHSAKLDDFEEEFTVVFNDEHLRKHGILESFYRFLRPFLYGRLTDLESFRVILEGNVASYFVFPGIYSGKSDIREDSVHGDSGRFFLRRAPRRRVKYHYSNRMHPIVFMNTANHAMAEEDNNTTLWKWEYVPWEADSPIVYGKKSRKQIEDLVKNLDERATVNHIVNTLRQENISDRMLMKDQKLRKQYVDHIRREYVVNKTTAEKFLDEAIAHFYDHYSGK